jgi:hypothetical protein
VFHTVYLVSTRTFCCLNFFGGPEAFFVLILLCSPTDDSLQWSNIPEGSPSKDCQSSCRPRRLLISYPRLQIYNLVLPPTKPPLLPYEPPLLRNEPPMLPDESRLLQNEPPLLCVYTKTTAFHKCFLKETVVWIVTWVFHRPQKYPWNPKSVSDLEASQLCC